MFVLLPAQRNVQANHLDNSMFKIEMKLDSLNVSVCICSVCVCVCVSADADILVSLPLYLSFARIFYLNRTRTDVPPFRGIYTLISVHVTLCILYTIIFYYLYT